MSASAWIRRQRDRPIADGERHAAMAVVAVLLATTALLLALTRPHIQPQRVTKRPSPGLARSALAEHTQALQSATAPLTAAVAQASRLFLAGYLGYLYGHTASSHIKDATQALARSLEAHPPRVSPGMRASAPRILALHTTPAAAGLVGVSALVTDGGLVDYRIGLLLAPRGGRLLVSELESGE